MPLDLCLFCCVHWFLKMCYLHESALEKFSSYEFSSRSTHSSLIIMCLPCLLRDLIYRIQRPQPVVNRAELSESNSYVVRSGPAVLPDCQWCQVMCNSDRMSTDMIWFRGCQPLCLAVGDCESALPLDLRFSVSCCRGCLIFVKFSHSRMSPMSRCPE